MRFTTSLLLVIMLATQGHAGDITSILAKYSDIEDEGRRSEFYRSLFTACGPSQLVALNSNANDSVATQSAWETVTLTVPEQDGPKVYRPDAETLIWFIGFFEGRNRVTAPEWWRTVIIDARANRRSNIYPGQPTHRPYHHSGVEQVSCPINAAVTENSRIVTYGTGDDSIVIPEELLRRADRGELREHLSCAFTKDQCFIAVHTDAGHPHKVACIDRKTGKIVWRSEACGCLVRGDATGFHESWVTVVPTDDGRVFVFGFASSGFYAHGFDAKNGKTLVRFSSDY